ncbi:MAG: hypothetical protein WC360_08110, partial [Opitutales bacterium]
PGLDSVYGSTIIADKFNVDHGVYEKPLNTEQYLDPSLTLAYAAELEAKKAAEVKMPDATK